MHLLGKTGELLVVIDIYMSDLERGSPFGKLEKLAFDRSTPHFYV